MVIITVLLMSFKWVGEMVGIKMKNLFQAGMALLGLAAVLCIAGGREGLCRRTGSFDGPWPGSMPFAKSPGD